jgi:hypothetical protein
MAKKDGGNDGQNSESDEDDEKDFDPGEASLIGVGHDLIFPGGDFEVGDFQPELP